MFYLYDNHLNKTSELIQRYVAKEKRPVLEEGYGWRDFKDVPMALMVHKSWDVEEDEEDGIKVFSFNLEDNQHSQLINPFMTVTIYPYEMVLASKDYKTYCYGFTEDIVTADNGNHEVIDKTHCFEKNGWYRCGLVRKESVDLKNDSTVMTIGLTDSVDQDVIVVRVIGKNEQLLDIFKPIEKPLSQFFLKRQLINLTSD